MKPEDNQMIEEKLGNFSDEESQQLRNIEYEQICEDWRHRDSMTWQSLAVSITITGVIFSVVSDLTWERIFLFSFSFLLNFTILLRISKDHYYQLGSIETLIYKLNGKALLEKIHGQVIDEYKEEYNLRRQIPSKDFLDAAIKQKKVPFPFFYKNVMLKISAYKLYILIQIILVIISLGSFLYEFIHILLKYFPYLVNLIN